MITRLINIVSSATNKIKSKLNVAAKLIVSEHFQERVCQRFEKDCDEALENCIQFAFKSLKPNEQKAIKHPHYGYTVVAKRVGLNGLELVTCYKGNELDD